MTLRSKIDYLITGMEQLQLEQGSVSPKLLRQIGRICSQLPTVFETTQAVQDEELLQCMMLVHSSLTARNAATLNDLTDKYTAAYVKTRGGFF
jgi:hypothetical protein